MSQNLDQKDLQILDLLQRNSNYSVKEIGEKIGLSFTPTYDRIKYLEKNGFIEKYAAILNRKKIGIDLVAYCNVTIRNQSKQSLDEFEQEIRQYDEVQEVLSLSGTYDYMLKIATNNIDTYNNFITNVLANTPNIYQYHSSIVLNEIKRENTYKLLEKEHQLDMENEKNSTKKNKL